MWRYGPNRGAASPNRLPDDFQLSWQLELGQRVTAWDDPLNQDLMSFDRSFEPIVMDGKLLLGFNDQDKLLAVDVASGRAAWTFFADAPIRLAPAGWRDRVFVCSDDGNLYCLRTADGELLWKFSGAPSAQHALGNRRLTSAWPARGGPVVRDNTVYFAASIWPFMGTFIYALDAESGQVTWVNDNTGSQYIKQPHAAPSFAGVGPQGALVATANELIVPGGRSVPAVFRRSDGLFRYFEINAGGKGVGGSFVAADDQQFFVHTRLRGTRAFDIESGRKSAFAPGEPVICGDHLFAALEVADAQTISCYAANEAAAENRDPEWSIAVNAADDLIAAGDHLVAAAGGVISIVAKPTKVDGEWRGGALVRQFKVGESVTRLLVADQRLIAVSATGSIYCFGNQDVAESPTTDVANTSTAEVSEARLAAAENRIAKLLKSGDAEGYALWFGPCDEATLRAWVKLSPFEQLAIVDADRSRVDRIRKLLDRLGAYGRITAHASTPQDFKPPPYVANMVFISRPTQVIEVVENFKDLYAAVRPYGGCMYVLQSSDRSAWVSELQHAELEQAQITETSWGVLCKREGPLPGSDTWTHQYGDISNTLKSDDSRVKLPLGVLWFGGSSNLDVLPRHGHGPPQQVVGGRLYIEGMNSLSARDVYTGRVLWQRQFENLGTDDVYFDDTYEDTPLDPQYNQVHIPGANARGTNYVVTDDRVYLLIGNACLMIDAVTGEDVGRIELPSDQDGTEHEWGFIGVCGDVLLGGVGFANYRARNDLDFLTDKVLTGNKAGFGSKSFDRAASRSIIGFDRHTGQQLWRIDAQHSFWHNGIVGGGGRIYLLDRSPAMIEDALRRRGISNNQAYRIVALEVRSGQPLWESRESIIGSWLGYSEKYDLLLEASAKASDRLIDEAGKGMRVFNAADGTVKWSKPDLTYNGPCILHNQWIITNTNAYAHSAGAFDIRTGRQRMTKNPLTGRPQPWQITRAYGCNNIIASENLLTFRSGAAGYYDLLTDAGTGNLGGFKSGCTSNLVVADGVLNAPDYTRTCSCAYQNQTSLALVHMPDLETWSINATAVQVPENQVIRTLGMNFGAPGDHRDRDGILWLDYPSVGGDSPELAITLNSEVQYFQRNSSTSRDELAWVYSSGALDVTELILNMRTQKRATITTKTASDDDEKTSVSAKSKEAATVKVAATEVTKDESADLPTEVTVFNDPIPATDYQVELYFALPAELNSQRHTFEVRVDGTGQFQRVELGSGDGSTTRSLHKVVFDSVELTGPLKVHFAAQPGSRTVLNGLRIIPAKNAKAKKSVTSE